MDHISKKNTDKQEEHWRKFTFMSLTILGIMLFLKKNFREFFVEVF